MQMMCSSVVFVGAKDRKQQPNKGGLAVAEGRMSSMSCREVSPPYACPVLHHGCYLQAKIHITALGNQTLWLHSLYCSLPRNSVSYLSMVPPKATV